MQFSNELRCFVEQNELFDNDDRILVAVSGGIDSTTLLDLLVKQGYKVAIAHCNFNLRGDESDGDEQYVRSLQEKYGIKGYYIRFDTEREAEQAKESIQMAARRLRYSWFNQLCNEKNYRYIAIAHNADDVAETFFLNLTRGTGIKGLTGIKPKTGRVVRPLLFATRLRIAEYAQANQLHFREDSSNAKDKYARNRIRLNVIPELKKINPSFSRTMLDNIARLQMVEDLVNQEVNSFKRDAVTCENEVQRISIRLLRHNRHAKLILFEYLCFYGFNSSQVDDILKSIDEGIPGSSFLSRTHVLHREREELILAPATPKSENEEHYIYENTTRLDYPIKMEVVLLPYSETTTIDRRSDTAYLDFDLLQLPLVIRKWQKGDLFQPFGMKGKKKVSDYFTDQKMTSYEKENQWLLCSANQIVWIMGRRADERFRVTENTRTILKIYLPN